MIQSRVFLCVSGIFSQTRAAQPDLDGQRCTGWVPHRPRWLEPTSLDRTFTGWRTTARSGNDNLRADPEVDSLNGHAIWCYLLLLDHMWSSNAHCLYPVYPCWSCLEFSCLQVLWRCWWTSSNWSNLSSEVVFIGNMKGLLEINILQSLNRVFQGLSISPSLHHCVQAPGIYIYIISYITYIYIYIYNLVLSLRQSLCRYLQCVAVVLAQELRCWERASSRAQTQDLQSGQPVNHFFE